jgi:8-oxo-dGTP pyrophosphatase MutT (NUDIX family)
VREIAGVVLLRDDGAALLQHRDEKPGLPHAGLWVPPGGHREPGEPIEVCARREFEEETGYRLDQLEFLTRFLDENIPGAPPSSITIFWGRYDGVQTPACYEGQALEFVPRSRADALKVPRYLVDVWDRALAAAAIAVTR